MGGDDRHAVEASRHRFLDDRFLFDLHAAIGIPCNPRFQRVQVDLRAGRAQIDLVAGGVR